MASGVGVTVRLLQDHAPGTDPGEDTGGGVGGSAHASTGSNSAHKQRPTNSAIVRKRGRSVATHAQPPNAA